MIYSFLAALYITSISWAWGMLLLLAIKKFIKEELFLNLNFAITCFCGLAAITVIAGFVSLFLPLGGVMVQAIFLFPAVAVFVRRELRHHLLMHLKGSLGKLQPAIAVSLAVAIIVCLVMQAGEIIHPDTLHYHAQCINWIAAYKAIPGLVNLGYHYGLQSSWFTASALFKFTFAGHNAPGFLAITTISWFLIFLHESISVFMRAGNAKPYPLIQAINWLLLLFFSCWSFTMIRGTVTSASPDFIAALYTWLVFLLFLQCYRSAQRGSYILLILFIACYAASIKLSAAPITAFAAIVYLAYMKRNLRSFIALILLLVFAMTPFITRNMITSGYPLFPLSFPDIVNADWKASKEVMADQRKYIEAYAKVADETALYSNEAVVNMTPGEWLPLWWQNRTLAAKLMLSGLALLFVLHLLLLKKVGWRANPHLQYIMLACIAGMVLWWIHAPDPRFAIGYMLPAGMVMLYMLPVKYFQSSRQNRKIVSLAIITFTVVFISYGGYRAIYHLNKENLLKPAGISAVSYNTISCYGLNFYSPVGEHCADTRLPCIYSTCKEFLPRGTLITDGFKAAAGTR